MNQKDLEYLREMSIKSETEDFSDKQLQKISEALSTNVYANDTTEALDLTAHIIYEQYQYENRLGQKRNVDVEKLDVLAKQIIDNGNFLGAHTALDIAEGIHFNLVVKQAEKGNIAKENVNLEREWNGTSILDDLLYASKSPLAVKSLIDKGGKFGSGTDSEETKDELIRRVTYGYKFQLKDYGENSVKNNLGNLAVLIETGMIERPKELDRLLSNPELFEKYPDIMNKLFEGDKDLQVKLDNVKNREELKGQKDDYLQEKLEEVRQAVKGLGRRKRRDENTDEEIPPLAMRLYAKIGKTGKSSEEQRIPGVMGEEKMQKIYQTVAETQKNAAKEVMKKHLEEKHNR